MKTAASAMILASLAGVACSSEPGVGAPTDGAVVGAPSVAAPGGSAGVPGAVAPGVTDPAGVPGAVAPGAPATDPVTGEPIPPAAVDPGTTPADSAAPPSTEEPIAPSNGACAPGVPTSSQIPRLTNLQYDAVVRDIFGVAPSSGTSWSESFEADTVGELPSTQWAQYRSAADTIAAAVLASPKGAELTCGAGDSACLDTNIRSLGRQMFRRPLTDDEVASFMALADVQPPGEPAEIAEAIVYTMLISPSFLTRAELDAPEEVVPGTEASPQTGFKLSNYEVASRLSFLIWNSIPDATLAAAADAGELQTKEQIRAQAERMLGEDFRDRVTPVITAAHRFYANIIETSSLSRWGKTEHDPEKFPEYSPAQTAPMMAEMDNFFADVGYSGQFQDLFLSNVAYVNQDTAPLYGLAAEDFGPELTRTELDATERPGFVTRAAFLSSFAHRDDTSPILRGAFLIRIMGGQTGNPDPAALNTQLPPGEYQTNREATQALTGVDAACQGCHWTNINPPGFVLENFSAVGSVQTTDPVYGGAIDTAVEGVRFPSGAKPIANVFELMTEVAAGRATKEIYAQKYVSYATGREANDYDLCTAQMIANNIDQGTYSLASVLADVTQAESFRLRVAAP